MTATASSSALLAQVDAAVSAGKLTADAAKNLKVWLTEARYSAYVALIAEHIQQEKWQALDDAFWRQPPACSCSPAWCTTWAAFICYPRCRNIRN